MEAVPKSVGAITLFIDNVERAKEFYGRAFEASAIYEDENSVVFGFENMVVNLLRVGEAPGLIGPAAVASREAGSRSSSRSGSRTRTLRALPSRNAGWSC